VFVGTGVRVLVGGTVAEGGIVGATVGAVVLLGSGKGSGVWVRVAGSSV
jgi:hypothetical protein